MGEVPRHRPRPPPTAPVRGAGLNPSDLGGLDLLVFDQSGLGDVAAELLPKTPPHIGLCLVGGDRPLTRSAHGDRLIVGKSWLIQRLGSAVVEHAPGPRSVAFLAAFHVAPIPSRSPLTCDDTKGRRFSTPKIKAAEASEAAQKRARTSRACGELYVLRLVGPVASPPHQFANASGLTRGLEKAALCHAGFKASLGLGWAHAQHSISRTYAPQPSSSASSRRRSASLGSAERQYHPQVSVQEAAARDEAIALVDLDRIMTRIRATEAKLALLSQGRQPPIG